MGPKSDDRCPYKRHKRRRHTETKGKNYVMMEAGIRVMLSQTKEHQEPSEAGGGKEEFFPVAFTGS